MRSSLLRPVLWCAAGAVAAAAHSAVNAWLLRRPTSMPPPADIPVSVLLPVRNEAGRLEHCLNALLGQRGVPEMEILVLDDCSTDGSGELVRTVAGGDPRLRLISGARLPRGWLGKPHACHQLSEAARARSEVLVFVDADVVLSPRAIASTVDCLLASGLDLVSPYPRQIGIGAGPRLVQPLLQWSWLSFLPLRLAERSGRPSLSAANGQLFAVRRAAYEAAGGHRAVRAEIVEDVALMRAVKAARGSGGIVDGTALATATMYDDWAALAEGYAKSLWTAFGSPARAAAVTMGLVAGYLVPPLAALRGSRAGLIGYLAGVTGRAVAAGRTGGRVWPDALAHPASVALFGWLVLRSVLGHRRGDLTWKGRLLP